MNNVEFALCFLQNQQVLIVKSAVEICQVWHRKAVFVLQSTKRSIRVSQVESIFWDNKTYASVMKHLVYKDWSNWWRWQKALYALGFGTIGFPQDTGRLLRLSDDSHYTLLFQSAKYCTIIQQDQFLDLLTNITHHPQNLLTFSNAQIPTALHAYETFRADLPYPAYVKT